MSSDMTLEMLKNSTLKKKTLRMTVHLTKTC